MKGRLVILTFLLLVNSRVDAVESLVFRGQASIWANGNTDADVPYWFGCRYIPQVNFKRPFGQRMVDMEASAHLSSTLGMESLRSHSADSRIKAYRLWARYSMPQLEIRLGLQKINFGSATLLRPLMWFDQVDPRDPLQLTDGVWGLLGRYYFLNNANLWMWLLRPADQPRNWELTPSHSGLPEMGGRIQYPLPGGEIGLSGHTRTLDVSTAAGHGETGVHEYRIGLDGKWDWSAGLWFEGSWTSYNRSLAALDGMTLLTLGADYTFGIGSGLNLLFETLWYAASPDQPSLRGAHLFSALYLGYPLSVFTRINAILYMDQKEKALYRFISGRREFGNLALNLMAFWNPSGPAMPVLTSSPEENLFSGKGVQIMMVWHH